MQTTNYNLYVEDDSSTRFIDWRQKMNGTDDSNMVKIDTVLGAKADDSIAVNTTLLASAWFNEDACYKQELDVTGLKEAQNGFIAISPDANAEQREIAREAVLSIIGQSDGKLTIASDGETPTADIPVTIVLLG